LGSLQGGKNRLSLPVTSSLAPLTYLPLSYPQRGSDPSLSNSQGLRALDLCQPQWSHAWRYTRQALTAVA